MHKLLEFVCDEMKELERKADKEGKLSMSEIQYLDTLAHTKKNLLTADAMMEDGEYSNMAYDGDGYGGSYARGGYTRVRGYNRDNRGMNRGHSNRMSYDRGYSREGDDIAEELHELMNKAPNEQVRKEIERLADKIDQM